MQSRTRKARRQAARLSPGMRMDIKLDETGWLQPSRGIALTPSPNFNERPDPADISLLVIHNISLPPGQFGTPYICDLFLNQIDLKADAWFACLEGLKVSAHFLIDRTGHITQFVSCDARAWHAGASLFEDRQQCNDFSIGIELEGTDTEPYTNAQYETLQQLTRCLTDRYRMRAVRGHQHIAPDRKTDPGVSFDWIRFRRDTDLPTLDWPQLGHSN